ncbi:MAG TPA: ATP-binding protein [Anaerolineales bacterium]|nr:ATP-binding protein [Anaerolineales bacterium]
MSVQIMCPQCGQQVQGRNRFCLHCGVDLAVAMDHAESFLMDPEEIPTGKPLSPEILVPRIGEYFVEMGLLTNEQLQSALAYQTDCSTQGRSILIGHALLELGLVDQSTLDQIITIQILKLQTALKQSNQSLYNRVQERTQELQKALERLSELNQLKSNFMATISHELRSPLTQIKGYLDLLLEGDLGPIQEQQLNILLILKKSEEKLERLIEDIIQFSFYSRGDLRIFQNPFDITTTIQESIHASKGKAQQKGINLIANLSAQQTMVWADKEKISWVMLHFLDNAIKFSENGKNIEVEANIQGRNIHIAVKDQGIGVPEERFEEIFEPFHQLENALTRRHNGTGLGLAIARRIIEAHSSQIKVKSEPEKGSCFEFSLPLYFEEMNGEY